MIKNRVGNIIELFYSTNNGRKNDVELLLDEKGVVEDKYYNKNTERSVLLVSIDSYELAKQKGIDVSYGLLGENLLMDFNPYSLKQGSRLQIGNAVLEISQYCTICNSFAKIDEKLPELLKDDRGIFAKIIQGGLVKKSDNIYLLD